MRIQLPLTAPTTIATHRGLNEIGRISVGEKRVSKHGKDYPASCDHFVCRGEHIELFGQLYGEKPASLPIRFYSSDTDNCCDERLELRDGAGKLVAYGDGETFWVFVEKAGRYVKTTLAEKPDFMQRSVAYAARGLQESKAKNIKWKSVLRVRFLLADFPKLGYFQFKTEAVQTSIPAIRNVFDECLKAFGTVQHIPFSLTVRLVKSNTPGKADQYPIVSLIPEISIEEGMRVRSLVLGSEFVSSLAPLALPAGPETELQETYLLAEVNGAPATQTANTV